VIRSKTLIRVASLAAVAALLAACGGGSEDSSATAAAPTGEPIVIGAPFAQSGPAGIADHKDCWNGTDLAIEEINNAGGVNGRPLKLSVTDIDILTPEGITAAFQKLAGEKVSAIQSPFVIIPPPALDAAAAYGAPYMSGDTNIDAQKLATADTAK
jgi:branched-chain amino acid transport system substrate-binding protein